MQTEKDALAAQIATLQSATADWEAKHSSVVTERDTLSAQVAEKDGHIKEASEKVSESRTVSSGLANFETFSRFRFVVYLS